MIDMDKFHQAVYNSIIVSGNKDNTLTYTFETAQGLKKECCISDLFKSIGDIEKKALTRLSKNNKILDVGAGGGRISFYLQTQGFDVTVLEKSNVICDILKKRNLIKVVNADIFKYFPTEKYDTILFFHTWSILGKSKDSIDKIFSLLERRLINRNGNVLFVFKDYFPEKGNFMTRRFVFNNQKSFWFKTHFFDSKKIILIGEKLGWSIKEFQMDDLKQYYIIMTK